MSAMSDLHHDASRVAAVRDLQTELREVAPLIAKLREMCGDDEQAFLDTLEGESDVNEAARRVVRWIIEQGAAEVSCRSLAETYTARARMFAERQVRAKGGLLDLLNELGVKSMPLPEATLSAKALPPSVVGEADPAMLADAFVRIKREADKAAIKAALQAGQFVPGYSLSNGGQTLQMKVSAS